MARRRRSSSARAWSCSIARAWRHCESNATDSEPPSQALHDVAADVVGAAMGAIGVSYDTQSTKSPCVQDWTLCSGSGSAEVAIVKTTQTIAATAATAAAAARRLTMNGRG